MMDEKNKWLNWQLSIDAWKVASNCGGFMRDSINGLRDRDGDPLPDFVKQFFLDVLDQKAKPGNRKFLPKDVILDVYRTALTQIKNDTYHTKRPVGTTPSDHAKICLSESFRVSPATIDQIVSPRKSRQPRKPRKS